MYVSNTFDCVTNDLLTDKSAAYGLNENLFTHISNKTVRTH